MAAPARGRAGARWGKCGLCLRLLVLWVPELCAASDTFDTSLIRRVSDMPGWQRAWTHEALEPLYNASLYPDLAVFRSRVRLASALGIANQLRRYHANVTRVRRGTAVVVARGGRVSAVTWEDFNPAFRIRVDSVVSELQRHADAGAIALPDSIFILNARDVPLCSLGFCLVPLFSGVKEVRAGKPYNEDLLVPLMAYPADDLTIVPRDTQINKGAMALGPEDRAAADGPGAAGAGEGGGVVVGELACRAFVARHAREGGPAAPFIALLPYDPQAAAAAAAGGQAQAQAVSGMSSPAAPPSATAPYAVALSCDAQTANPGLAGLLASSSLVLKGRSNWAEYYYRLLQDGVHYMEFDPGFAGVKVKEVLEHGPAGSGSASALQAGIVEAAQRFAYTYLSQRSRALYFAKAIAEYNTLFGEGYMQATVAELPTGRPLAMSDILALRMYPRAWRQGLARRRRARRRTGRRAA